MTSPHEREIGHELAGAMRHSTGAYELVVAAIAAAGFGWLIDRAFGTTPLFLLIFAIVGFIGACVSLYHRYRIDMSSATEQRANRAAQKSITPSSGAGATS